MDTIALHPPQASTLAPQVDLLFYALLAFSFGLGLLLATFMISYVVRYRRGSNADRSGEQQRNLVFEVSWTSASALIALGIFLWGANLFLERDHPPADAMLIAGFPKQWIWKFQQPDGRWEINELHVPIGKPIIVRLRSEDVIHSLFIPAFRIKQDAVPGRLTSVWFEATKAGTYDLFCAEFCGTQHSEMRGHVIALPEEEFAKWLETRPTEQSIAEQGASLFRSFGCSGCHGPNSTVRAPRLEGVFGHPVPLQSGGTVIADEAYVRDSVLEPLKDVVAGYAPVMPSFKGLVEEDELNKLVAYVKSLATQEVQP